MIASLLPAQGQTKRFSGQTCALGTSGAMYSLGFTLSGPNGKQKPPRACAGGKPLPEVDTFCGSSNVQKSSTALLFSTATRATKQLLNICFCACQAASAVKDAQLHCVVKQITVSASALAFPGPFERPAITRSCIHHAGAVQA